MRTSYFAVGNQKIKLVENSGASMLCRRKNTLLKTECLSLWKIICDIIKVSFSTAIVRKSLWISLLIRSPENFRVKKERKFSEKITEFTFPHFLNTLPTSFHPYPPTISTAAKGLYILGSATFQQFPQPLIILLLLFLLFYLFIFILKSNSKEKTNEDHI